MARASPWRSSNLLRVASTRLTPSLMTRAYCSWWKEASRLVLYTQTLRAGDMFIFPKCLIHYQFNADASKTAMAIAAFGSAKGGSVSIPATMS
ncbi:hypothetical protein RJ639_010635 [Escallonia herrerae]|uniref:Germin-like protein n=1 Tax=Escallonia herrerae TaxID=1293975 RepID=A0AA88VJY4_9ASTE|nr:hypothetical protein RJ639_010635 [Escallonia herrerae]